MKLLLKYAAFLACALSAGGASAQSWRLVWSDEFNGAIGPDWTFETGNGSEGWGNRELQYYRRENATIENNALVITAKREDVGGFRYTSSRMKTQGIRTFKYGRIEARMRLPAHAGAWPAFWMLGANLPQVGWPAAGEIDVMEHINDENKTYGTIHWQDNTGNYAQYGGNTVVDVAGWHTYAVEWDASAIRWYVDGAKFHEVNIQNGVNGTDEFQKDFFLLLNFAIGGNWPGFTVDDSKLPSKMYVDYVRVYAPDGGSGVATVYQHCSYGGYAVALPEGRYTLGQMQQRGIFNDNVSSVRVSPGYQVTLFRDDNFAGRSLNKTADGSCLQRDGFNDQASSLIVSKAQSATSILIQAENFSVQNGGVQVEPCSEGGQNVGWIDPGDWMVYNNIAFAASGTYRVEYRVSSPSGASLSLDLNAGSLPLGQLAIPATNGWQNWTTIAHTVNVNAGTYALGLYAPQGGWNINWIRITKL